MSARLLLFDLYTGGHHRHYLEMIARAWVTGDREGQLEIAAPEQLFQDHADFGEWLGAQDPTRVQAVPLMLPTKLGEGSTALSAVLQNDLLHGKVLTRLLKDRRPDHVLAMYFDHVQASLALRRIPTNARPNISGIYFRPSFHFPEEPALTRFRKRRLLQAALSHRGVHRVLTLDPFVVDELQDPRVVWLPDGFNPAPAAGGANWQVDLQRSPVLFFGVVSQRKGILEVLRALPRMEAAREAALVIAGRIPVGELGVVRGAIEHARLNSDVQIIHDDRYIPENEIQNMFRAARVALVAYQQHTGSSNVLIRAAAEGIPVVGPSYGLMGRLIKQHALGVAVDTANPDVLARAMSDGVRRRLEFDADAGRAFAQSNTAERFTETLFREILSAGGRAAGGGPAAVVGESAGSGSGAVGGGAAGGQAGGQAAEDGTLT